MKPHRFQSMHREDELRRDRFEPRIRVFERVDGSEMFPARTLEREAQGLGILTPRFGSLLDVENSSGDGFFEVGRHSKTVAQRLESQARRDERVPRRPVAATRRDEGLVLVLDLLMQRVEYAAHVLGFLADALERPAPVVEWVTHVLESVTHDSKLVTRDLEPWALLLDASVECEGSTARRLEHTTARAPFEAVSILSKAESRLQAHDFVRGRARSSCLSWLT